MHHPRKRFGQHFLTDPSILMELFQCLHLQKTDRVVEIGPGQGALTEFLISAVDHVDAVELDRDLVTYLQAQFDSKRLTVHSADALDFPFASLATEKKLRIVGNLPYNISTPLLFKLFAELHCIEDMHFMLQKEVVLRLTAKTGSADYGRLSIMSQYFCDNALLFYVPPTAFDPPPKVDSAVVSLTPKKRMPLTPAQFAVFSDIVKEAFNYRRKTLSNSLKRFCKITDFQKAQIDPTVRPQDITVDQYIRLSQSISVE